MQSDGLQVPLTKTGKPDARYKRGGTPGGAPKVPNAPTGRRASWVDTEWVEPLLAIVSRNGSIAEATRTLNISSQAVYDYKLRNPSFATALKAAREEAVEMLEAVAFKRAQQGSDRLLMFMLEHLKPETYRSRLQIDLAREEAKRLASEFGLPLDEVMSELEDALKEFKQN